LDILHKTFTDDEEKWFIANFYMYMNYHPTDDYPINLENVYKLIGFANKGNAKAAVEHNFNKHDDYKILASDRVEARWGGKNKENILLNVDTFKNLCLVAKSDLGKKVRKYYLKIEHVYNDLINHDRIECQRLLDAKILELENLQDSHELDLKLKQEDVFIKFFCNKKICYITIFCIDDVWYIKFGHTKEIQVRLPAHKREISGQLYLVFCIETLDEYKLEAEFKKDKNVINNRVKIPGLKEDEFKTEIIKIKDENDYGYYTRLLNKLNKDIVIDKEITLKKLDLEIIKENNSSKICTTRCTHDQTSEVNTKVEKIIITEKDIELRKIDLEMRKIDLEMKKIELEMKKSADQESSLVTSINEKQTSNNDSDESEIGVNSISDSEAGFEDCNQLQWTNPLPQGINEKDNRFIVRVTINGIRTYCGNYYNLEFAKDVLLKISEMAKDTEKISLIPEQIAKFKEENKTQCERKTFIVRTKKRNVGVDPTSNFIGVIKRVGQNWSVQCYLNNIKRTCTFYSEYHAAEQYNRWCGVVVNKIDQNHLIDFIPYEERPKREYPIGISKDGEKLKVRYQSPNRGRQFIGRYDTLELAIEALEKAKKECRQIQNKLD
jgi:phage anti-repressor protein